MIHLRILGSPLLEDSNGGDASGLLSQPKRLALLAFLAAGGRHLVARDKVLGAFWGEQPEERARHALNQGLHVLRRVLGPRAIAARGERLGVDPAQVWCDAAEFREALRAGDRARAVELYRGPLLDGLFVPDAPEFERWLEDSRAELHGLAAAAAARLADEAVAAGDPGSVAVAARAAELAPLDEPAARRLITLLDREGRPGAAVAAFDAFARRLRADCDLAPSTELRAVVATIRARAAAAAPLRPTPPSPAAEGASTVPTPAPAALASPSVIRRRPSGFARALIAAAAVVLVSGGLWLLRSGGRELHAARVSDASAVARVAVLPFTVQGPTERGDSLGRDLVELLGSRLDGAGPIHVVPADSILAALAGRSVASAVAMLGTGSVIEGAVTASGSTLHLRASWRRRADQAVLSEATAEGDAGSLLGLLDTLAIRLLAEAQPVPQRALARTAALSATSLPALRAYLDGDQAFAEGRFNAATRAFERAIALDSSFALAQYRLGVVALWAVDYPLAAFDAGARALRHSARLPDIDRRTLVGFDAWRRGDWNDALTNFLSILASDRDNLEAWFQLGETLFHYNPVRGHPVSESRDAFVQVLRLDPDHWGALWHLALLDALEGRTTDMDRRADHLLALGPDSDYRLEIAVMRACAHHDPPALARQTDALRATGDSHLLEIAWRCAVYGRDLEGTEAIARILLPRQEVAFSVGSARLLLAMLEMTRGHRLRALAQLDSLGPEDYASPLGPRTAIALAPLVGASRNDLEALARDWKVRVAPPPAWNPGVSWEEVRVTALGRLEAALGQTLAANAWAERMESVPDPPATKGLSHAVALDIRAEAAAQVGDSGRALNLLEGVWPDVWLGILVTNGPASRPWVRFERAALLENQGRYQEALRWYGTLDELSPYDLMYTPAAHLRRAGILEREGANAAAAAEYSRFLDLWKDADADLQPWVTAARDRLTRLSAHR